jgi:hypothetical protein
LLSGRDPSTFSSTRSANFAAANNSSQIASTDRIQIIIDFIVGRFSSAKKEQVPRSAIDYKEKREVYLGLEEAGTYMEMYV